MGNWMVRVRCCPLGWRNQGFHCKVSTLKAVVAGPIHSRASMARHSLKSRGAALPYHLDRHEAGIGCLQRHFGSRIVGPGRTADGHRLLRHGKVGRAHRQLGAAYCYFQQPMLWSSPAGGSAAGKLASG